MCPGNYENISSNGRNGVSTSYHQVTSIENTCTLSKTKEIIEFSDFNSQNKRGEVVCVLLLYKNAANRRIPVSSGKAYKYY